jgi:hypothetical protein
VSTQRPGGLGRLQVRRGTLHLEVLDDDGHHLELALPVDHARTHALHHLHAVQADPHTRTLPSRPQVDLLRRSLAALGARAEALVVAAGPPASFHLAIRDATGQRCEVTLDVVDAAGLIFSRRVPLEVRAPATDWDHEVAELLSDR